MKENNKNTSPLYKNSSGIPFSLTFSLHMRRKMFDFFMKVYKPTAEMKILDVGVTSDDTFSVSNFFEKWYPYKNNITCVGTENGFFLEEKFKGIKYFKVISGEPLPFNNKEFDIAFSNAVIEHTGSTDGQAFFVNEICRVCKAFFISTPNRWFPVETHTGIPLLHYLPKDMFRKYIRGTKYDYWSYEKNLNLLDYKDFKNLFPEDINVIMKKVNFLMITTNLIAYTLYHNI